MKLALTFLIGIGLFISCSKSGKSTLSDFNSTADDSPDPKDNLNIQISSFEEIGNTGIILFPLSMGESKYNSSKSYKDIRNTGNWNIIFYDTQSSQYYLVTDKKVIIKSYHYKLNNNYNEINNNESAYDYIFYSVIYEDYNKDKVLTGDDPEYLFVSDKTGKNFRQISPSGCSVVSWNYSKNTHKVIMTARRDSDKNKKFEVNDEISTFEFDLETSTQPRELFSTEFKNKLKSLYDRDWKRIN